MRRLLLACALVLGTAAPAGAAEPGSDFASYTMLANAPGIGLSGLYRDVAFTVPETTSSLSTGGVGASLASLAWPGPILGNLGTTILVLSSEAPPQVTALNDPVRAEARSGGTQKASYTQLPGTVMTATATNDVVTAASRTSNDQLPVGTLGGFSGTTRTAFEGAGKAVGTAKGVVTDLDLAGGVVHIGSVVSTAAASTDGARGRGSGTTTVGDVTIAGVPVTIDEHGVHVQGTALPVAADAVEQAVAQLGLTMLLTEPRTVVDHGAVRVEAGALVIAYEDKALTLGRASVALTAGKGGLLPQAPLPTLPPVAGAPAGTTGSGALPTPALSLPRTDAVPPAAPPPTTIGTVQAAVVSLAHGASGVAVLGLLALAGLLVAATRRLPDALLADDHTECR